MTAAYPTPTANAGAPAGRRPRTWLRMFLFGLVLWLATVVVTFATGNPNLIPTLVLLGSFLVPVTFVAWAFERRDTGELSAGLVFGTFVAGGLLGVLGASVLESYLLRPSPLLFIGVGLIEEGAKLAALALLTRRLAEKSVRDGMILGAAVGFGFAAFESAGYAFTALFTENGLSLIQLVQTEILRGLLAPLGHGLWTAILGGVLFSASDHRHFAITPRLFGAYIAVSLLHALWDSMHTIAVYLTLLFTGGESVQRTGEGWLVRPTGQQAALFPVVEWSGLAVVSAIGVGWLLLEWRLARGRPARPEQPMRAWRVPIRPVGA